jgi:hypothetical protein
LTLAAGVVGGVATNLQFNVFRYGTAQNGWELVSYLRVPSLMQHAINLAALWVSPNGGLLVFAPWLTLAVVALALRRGPSPWPERVATASPLLLLGVLTLGLARWFSPFGWISWGPRFCTPWLPSLLLVALTFEGARCEALMRRVLQRRGAAVAGMLLVLTLAAPHLLMLPKTDRLWGFFTANPDCPVAADVRRQPAEFYVCHNGLSFPRHELVLLGAFNQVDLAPVPLAGYAVLLVGLCAWLRRELFGPT